MSDGQDRVSEVTHTGFFQRIGNSITGVLIGIALLFLSIGVLFWNEGRAVTTARSLAEGRGLVVSIDPARIDPANDGRLVHASGVVTISQSLQDPLTGVSAEAVRLVRVVEMFQWREKTSSETHQTSGGGTETVTTYSYDKAWVDHSIDSGDFHSPAGHANPAMPFAGDAFQVSSAGFGAFTLGRRVLDEIDADQDLPIAQIPSDFSADLLGLKSSISGGRILLSARPEGTSIGDMRIGYRIAPVGETSLIAQQTGDGFSGYRTRAGDTLLMVEPGRISAEDMFASAEADNTIFTWIVRVVGLLVLFIAFGLITGPITVLSSIVPILGSIVSLGTGLFAFLATLVLGGGTIALAWVFYRPFVAIALVGLLALVIVATVMLARRRKPPLVAAA